MPSCRAALAAKQAELAHAEAELAESEAQVKTLSAKYDRVKQHLEHDEQALAAQRAEYEEAQAAAREAAASSQAAVAAEAARQRTFLEQVMLVADIIHIRHDLLRYYWAQSCALRNLGAWPPADSGLRHGTVSVRRSECAECEEHSLLYSGAGMLVLKVRKQSLCIPTVNGYMWCRRVRRRQPPGACRAQLPASGSRWRPRAPCRTHTPAWPRTCRLQKQPSRSAQPNTCSPCIQLHSPRTA